MPRSWPGAGHSRLGDERHAVGLTTAAYTVATGVVGEPTAPGSRNGGAVPWVLSRGKLRWERQLQGRLTANSPELLARIAARGAGIAGSSLTFAEPYLRTGELVRVLPEWDLPAAGGWAVFPGRRLMPAKTRAFLDLMEEVCRERGQREPGLSAPGAPGALSAAGSPSSRPGAPAVPAPIRG